MGDGFMGLDIGPESICLNDAAIAKSKTIVWNGPMGVFEMAPFEDGTKRMMDKIVEVTKAGAISVIGGGDSHSLQEVQDSRLGIPLQHRGRSISGVAGRQGFAWRRSPRQ